jgi:hypothetical protein
LNFVLFEYPDHLLASMAVERMGFFFKEKLQSNSRLQFSCNIV